MIEISQGQIFLPALALVSLTFLVLTLVLYRRVKSGFAGSVTKDDFSLGESEKVPEYVIVANRNYINLLELPVLFYFACILSYLLEAVEIKLIVLAWIYVVFRFFHSVIHLSYNNVYHRLTVFALSNIVLIAMWCFLIPPLFTIAMANA